MADLPPDPDPPKPPHVFTEDVKQRHVSHWDLDYLSTEQLEEAYADAQPDLPRGVVVDDFLPKNVDDPTAAKGAPPTEVDGSVGG